MKHFFLTILYAFAAVMSAIAAPEFHHGGYYILHAATSNIECLTVEGEFGTPITAELKAGDKIIGYWYEDMRAGTEEYYTLISKIDADSKLPIMVSIKESSYNDIASATTYALIQSDYTYELEIVPLASDSHALTVSPVQQYKDHIVGDMNGDGKLSVEDLTLLTATLLGERTQREIYGFVVPQEPTTYKLIITTQDLTSEEYDPSIGTANEYTASQLSAGVQIALPPYTKSIAYPANLGNLEVKGPLGVITLPNTATIVLNKNSYKVYAHRRDIGNTECNTTITIK